MSSIDITEMMAFEQIEPFGDMAADFRAGMVCATFANVNRDSDKRRDPFTPEDFMPSLAREHVEAGPILKSTPEEQSALLDRTLFGKF